MFAGTTHTLQLLLLLLAPEDDDFHVFKVTRPAAAGPEYASEQKPHYKGQSVIQQQRAYKECSQYVVSVEGKLKTGRKMQGN